ncbi:hypothetical protein GNP63_01540 [Aliivibrio fischeri]|uniref:hypothetical protein n=1 Tax=Aliivibrio fischeri TaxID=668 RepID=UPI00135D8E73|nr:hypothetical protein [Aliivibrio fischeri]MUI65463.1 hypothetical protein [Aliivibrio fischeri]
MKIVFVDVENIGLTELGKIKASIVDKVFVFSRMNNVRSICEKKSYLCLSNYPEGSNQADFYIIAYLSRLIALLSQSELKAITFELFSNDESLISAFQFQCVQLEAQYRINRTKKDKVKKESKVKTALVITKLMTQSPEAKIYAALKSPQALDENFRNQLKLSKSNFNKAINELSKANRITRLKDNKKKWVRGF